MECWSGDRERRVNETNGSTNRATKHEQNNEQSRSDEQKDDYCMQKERRERSEMNRVGATNRTT
ncbi:hypothetical protein SESBI_16691 [Sesbania bispinosa]|nr:hypothetical protein SESBI_16691 [Sesbania bispinosa]